MPIEVKDGVDIINNSGGLIAGLVGAITAFGWWARRERTEKAKSEADVSASGASVSASDSQARQIDALTKRVNEQGEAIIRLLNDLAGLKTHIARHEASVVGISILLPAIHLCGECEVRYQPILNEISRIIKDLGDRRSESVRAHIPEEK